MIFLLTPLSSFEISEPKKALMEINEPPTLSTAIYSSGVLDIPMWVRVCSIKMSADAACARSLARLYDTPEKIAITVMPMAEAIVWFSQKCGLNELTGFPSRKSANRL